uniref:Protein kinase domain-containing protein n=1 Tax=Leersia perrieri TaxID=77586 RepID=A0A0D9WDT4_9ORYZ
MSSGGGGGGDDYKREESVALMVIVSLAALSLLSLVAAFAYYCYITRKVSRRLQSLHLPKRASSPPPPPPMPRPPPAAAQGKESPSSNSASDGAAAAAVVAVGGERGGVVQVFSYRQLHAATGGFGRAHVVGQGSFGAVYRGVLPDGRKVAVKLMDRPGKQGEEEFEMEVELLSRLRSPYLLGLIGHCSEGGHRLLVYEFMANGGLQEHLYPNGALEAAKGLEYLHERVNPPVIHRDFKSSNILLDKDFRARVSDFGLAKLGSDRAGGHVSTRVLGTQGYVAPEYALTGHLTTKSDVYSYGVVLLELLTGRVPVDMKRPPGEGVLVNWALPMLTDREKVVQILDPALEGQYSLKDAVQVAAIAAMCVQQEADYRPLMADVVQSLVPLVKNRSTPKACNPGKAIQIPNLVAGQQAHGMVTWSRWERFSTFHED